MASQKHKTKSAEGQKSTPFICTIPQGKKEPDSNEEMLLGHFKSARSRPISFVPNTFEVGLNLMEDPSFDARHVLGPREVIDDDKRR